MTRVLLTLTLTVAMLLSACASAPGGTGGAPTAPSASAPAPPIAAPVALPDAARRRLVLAMTGPKAVVESKDWPAFKREWRDTFAEHAKQAGVAFAFSDTEPGPTGEDGTIVLVEVSDYRLVGIGARIMLGVMTGNAFIEARARYSSLRDGTPFGEQPYSTTSSAWSGIFAKVTPQQVDSIAASVLRSFAAARP